MKNYIKWGTVAIAIILIVSGLALFITKLFSSDNKATEVPSPEQQAIIDTSFEKVVPLDEAELNNPSSVYNIIHYMANTKIEAVDGLRWGLEPMTRNRIEIVKNAVTKLQLNDPNIDAMLDRWAKQDFSQCVEEHNYIWSKYLHGDVGKAKKLR